MKLRTNNDQLQPLAVLHELVQLAEIDTLYRDLYLEVARNLMGSMLDETRFRMLKQSKERLETVTLQSRAAIEQGDWGHLPPLVSEIETLRSTLDSVAQQLELAGKIYDAEPVCIDPFSPGLQRFLSAALRSRQSLRETVNALCANLVTTDSAHAAFYRARQEWFKSQSREEPDTLDPAAEPAGKTAIEKALSDLNTGALDDLRSLAERMAGAPKEPDQHFAAGAAPKRADNPELAAAFPHRSLDNAARLQLAPLELPAEPEISSFIHHWAWQPGFPDPTVTQDGKIVLQNIAPDRIYPDGMPAQRQSVLDLFMIHPFINSGGGRYIPQLVSEQLLVETFPEDEPPTGSPLLEALFLPRRAGLSRAEIEQALLRHGSHVVKTELALDPTEFRLACIPYDAYCRLGNMLGLGNHPHWTHFDGYQVLKSGKLHALVGGDVRFGGAYDLCSISSIDERDGLIARFVVVRRTRFSPS